MTEIRTDHELPGAAVPYVVRHGRGLRHRVATDVVTTLAGGSETAGGFGVLATDSPRAHGPIPMHYHEREYDTWLCTRGQLQVWSGDESRVLRPGDFGYVKPYDTHSYQGISPRMSFFGVVAPGGWEEFMADAGEVWGITAMPPSDRPFDFSRMGPAMAKHDVHPVRDARFAEASAMDETNQRLPEGNSSYFLEAGHGKRHLFHGHLATALITARQCDGTLDMRTVEAGRDAVMPALRHERTAVFLYLLHGEVALSLAGTEYRLTGGDGANVPAGAAYATRVLSGTARWVQVSANGDGGEVWARAGTATESFAFPMEAAPGDAERLCGLSGIDVALA